jgi:hypothetical protein
MVGFLGIIKTLRMFVLQKSSYTAVIPAVGRDPEVLANARIQIAIDKNVS